MKYAHGEVSFEFKALVKEAVKSAAVKFLKSSKQG